VTSKKSRHLLIFGEGTSQFESFNNLQMNPPINLFSDAFWISPYVFSNFIALKEKGLGFTVKEIALQEKEQKKPEFAQSITGRVPSVQIVRDDGSFFWIAESSAIAEYLEEKYPPPKYPALFPQGIEQRARARQIMAWMRSDLLALREERPTSSMFYEKTTTPLTSQGKADADKLIQVAEAVISETSENLFGTYTLVDSELAFMLHRLILNNHEIPAKVFKYATAQWKRASVQEWVNHSRKPYIPY